ncbi:hypothetical protein [uncultured Anaerococcus sp.]|uniref:hypothetical protein n=1 Tax=uncultured Anaerococcus sp. TaxID=293428 RepID=UPI00280B9E1F|nr:hypothetical protein [uncultured Anaerococcus sp.]MDU5149477.1 hypothetical protein [Anaerococcus prevotii]
MKTLAAIFLLILIVYNLRIASFSIYKVKPKLYIFIIGILLSLTFFYLWLNYTKDLPGFILGLLAICLFFTFTLGQGLREDGFVLFLGTSPILKFVSFNDIKEVNLSYDRFGDFILEIKAHSTTYKQIYSIGDRDKIIDFLSKNLDYKFNIK